MKFNIEVNMDEGGVESFEQLLFALRDCVQVMGKLLPPFGPAPEAFRRALAKNGQNEATLFEMRLDEDASLIHARILILDVPFEAEQTVIPDPENVIRNNDDLERVRDELEQRALEALDKRENPLS